MDIAQSALSELEPRARDAIQLAYRGDNTHEEVAVQLGITAGAASGVIYRARSQLRELLAIGS